MILFNIICWNDESIIIAIHMNNRVKDILVKIIFMLTSFTFNILLYTEKQPDPTVVHKITDSKPPKARPPSPEMPSESKDSEEPPSWRRSSSFRIRQNEISKYNKSIYGVTTLQYNCLYFFHFIWSILLNVFGLLGILILDLKKSIFVMYIIWSLIDFYDDLFIIIIV